MPIVQIQLLEGRSIEQKKIITEVIDAIVKSADVPKENVGVIFTEIPLAHWGAGGKTKDEKNVH